MRAAVTGVTGYVGGRLVPELLRAGFEVRALARHPERLAGREWVHDVETVGADAADLEQTRAALQGADVAYYLVHSLGTGSTFEARDRRTALTFARAAREAGVGRIVYLGGMFPDVPEGELSRHLASRKEVGEILLASGVPTTVLQAAVILGSGSASFEMMRYLTERLPAMTTPKWVDNRIQPIAVRDVLRYLVGSATMPPDVTTVSPREIDDSIACCAFARFCCGRKIRNQKITTRSRIGANWTRRSVAPMPPAGAAPAACANAGVMNIKVAPCFVAAARRDGRRLCPYRAGFRRWAVPPTRRRRAA